MQTWFLPPQNVQFAANRVVEENRVSSGVSTLASPYQVSQRYCVDWAYQKPGEESHLACMPSIRHSCYSAGLNQKRMLTL